MRFGRLSILTLALAAWAAANDVTAGFESFRDKAWIAGEGTVVKVLEDDLEPPCHQRFLLADENGRTLLVVNNIEGWARLADVAIGKRVRFQGEFIANDKGGLVHWTHPDPNGLRPGGFLKIVEGAEKKGDFVAGKEIKAPALQKEYFAGRGPVETRPPAPVNGDWPETGYWLSTNSGARHNKRCPNYRKTRGYPCKKDEGRPCGKCGG